MKHRSISTFLFSILIFSLASAQCPLTFTAIQGICANAPGTVIALPGFTTYEWSSGETTNIINPTVPGVYTVTVTIPNNCTAEGSVTVTAFTATWELLPNNNGCEGGTYSFLVTVTDPPDLIWAVNIQVGNGPVQTFFQLIPGVTTLQIDLDIFASTTVSLLEVVDANGLCPAILFGDTEIDIAIIAAPDISGDFNICENQSSVLTVTPAYDTYLWSTGETSQSISVGQPGAYSATVSDGGGCTATATVVVEQNPLPTVEFATQNVCPSGCQMVDVAFVGSAPFVLTYQVSVGGSQETFTQTFGNNTASIEVCPPPGYEGPVNVQATVLADAFCACQ